MQCFWFKILYDNASPVNSRIIIYKYRIRPRGCKTWGNILSKNIISIPHWNQFTTRGDMKVSAVSITDKTFKTLPLYARILRMLLAWYRISKVLYIDKRQESVCERIFDSSMKYTIEWAFLWSQVEKIVLRIKSVPYVRRCQWNVNYDLLSL